MIVPSAVSALPAGSEGPQSSSRKSASLLLVSQAGSRLAWICTRNLGPVLKEKKKFILFMYVWEGAGALKSQKASETLEVAMSHQL